MMKDRKATSELVSQKHPVFENLSIVCFHISK